MIYYFILRHIYTTKNSLKLGTNLQHPLRTYARKSYLRAFESQPRLARGETRDGESAEDELIRFDLGPRRIRLQANVHHNGDGMDEGNLVTITIANRSEDGLKVCLSASLSGLDTNGHLVDLARKENVTLKHGKRFTLFAFKATDASRYCNGGNLLLRLEVSFHRTPSKSTG